LSAKIASRKEFRDTPRVSASTRSAGKRMPAFQVPSISFRSIVLCTTIDTLLPTLTPRKYQTPQIPCSSGFLRIGPTNFTISLAPPKIRAEFNWGEIRWRLMNFSLFGGACCRYGE
jgi:hypothetical protein